MRGVLDGASTLTIRSGDLLCTRRFGTIKGTGRDLRQLPHLEEVIH